MGHRVGQWLPMAGIAALLAVAAQAQAPQPRRSGFDEMSPATQAMQRDDAQNPAMLWAQEGAQLWSREPAPTVQSCAGCHGDARTSMRGVAARYPALDAARGRPIDLATRINDCREQRQRLPRLAVESQDLLALESHVALQSRGLPVSPPDDARLVPWRGRGEVLYRLRIGQLNLSCAQCHDERAGQRLAGSPIPQGRANGYPLYRLEWQGMGSLWRRIRNCMTGVRAEPWPADSAEFAALEVYLASRDEGLAMESPAVRP